MSGDKNPAPRLTRSEALSGAHFEGGSYVEVTEEETLLALVIASAKPGERAEALDGLRRFESSR